MSFGKSTREFRRKDNPPGPGEYNHRALPKKTEPKYSFGNDTRGKTLKAGTPGPGSYNIPPKFNDVPKYLLNK